MTECVKDDVFALISYLAVEWFYSMFSFYLILYFLSFCRLFCFLFVFGDGFVFKSGLEDLWQSDISNSVLTFLGSEIETESCWAWKENCVRLGRIFRLFNLFNLISICVRKHLCSHKIYKSIDLELCYYQSYMWWIIRVEPGDICVVILIKKVRQSMPEWA